MTCYSVLRNRLFGSTSIDTKHALPLAIGCGILGGICGRAINKKSTSAM